MSSDHIIGGIALIFFFVFEGVFPYFTGWTGRIKHGVNHLFLAGMNGVINALVGVLVLGVMILTQKNSFGLLYIFGESSVVRVLIGFVLFDMWMYAWHRINHERLFFWRYHKVHHTDMQMDTTTALRFHPVEIIFSNILRIYVFLILGLNLRELLIYETVLLPVILFHHSNVNLPEKYDKLLRTLIVTPNMHRVHHSWTRKETDSNYSSVFSFWDRLFGSFCLKEDPHDITFGLERYREPKWQNLWGLLITPLKKEEPHGSY